MINLDLVNCIPAHRRDDKIRAIRFSPVTRASFGD
jgi:hypothetical protein